MKKAIDTLIKHFKTKGLKCRGIVKKGNVTDHLIMVAEKYKCNLIVLGIGEKNKFHYPMDHIAKRILQVTHKPVMMVS